MMLKFPRSSPGFATLGEHPYLEGLAGGCSKTIPTKGDHMKYLLLDIHELPIHRAYTPDNKGRFPGSEYRDFGTFWDHVRREKAVYEQGDRQRLIAWLNVTGSQVVKFGKFVDTLSGDLCLSESQRYEAAKEEIESWFRDLVPEEVRNLSLPLNDRIEQARARAEGRDREALGVLLMRLGGMRKMQVFRELEKQAGESIVVQRSDNYVKTRQERALRMIERSGLATSEELQKIRTSLEGNKKST
jgi:hypothetical protein